jgi:hypothetical protein
MKNNLYLFLVFLSLTSCNAIFEEDLTGDTPVVIIPSENDTVYSNNVHFKWEEMKGASFYNLQIVSPNFSDINAYILDSNIKTTEFFQILEPGNYAFRLRAENGGYQSLYAGPFNFYVDSVEDLSEQFVSLVSPVDQIYINGASNLTVTWQNLFAADEYEFILKIGDTFVSASVLDQEFDLSSLSKIIPSSFWDVEGAYFWGIRAVNLSSVSPYSSRQINVDKTQPNNPAAISPANDVTVPIATPVVFKWAMGIDPGTVNSPVTSTFEISSDISFTDFSAIPDIDTDSLSYTFPTTGNFWWRVKLVDGVGNQSSFYSTARTITIE